MDLRCSHRSSLKYCNKIADSFCSYIPTALVASHFLAIGYLSFIALHTIHRSYAALPPSAAVRDREPIRKGYVHTFSILALLSLASAFVYGMKFGSLSYQVWATERGIELPEGYTSLCSWPVLYDLCKD